VRIALGSDHAGYGLKEAVKSRLVDLGHQAVDLGASSRDSVDYPDYGAAVAQAVAAGSVERGILICGSGLGMCMVANRFHGVRAALAASVEHARLGRLHNDANVLCLGERLTSQADAMAMVDAFLATEFEGGRHEKRLQKMESLSEGQ
jgi:ribose 5-phosphate isomerase B